MPIISKRLQILRPFRLTKKKRTTELGFNRTSWKCIRYRGDVRNLWQKKKNTNQKKNKRKTPEPDDDSSSREDHRKNKKERKKEKEGSFFFVFFCFFYGKNGGAGDAERPPSIIAASALLFRTRDGATASVTEFSCSSSCSACCCCCCCCCCGFRLFLFVCFFLLGLTWMPSSFVSLFAVSSSCYRVFFLFSIFCFTCPTSCLPGRSFWFPGPVCRVFFSVFDLFFF